MWTPTPDALENFAAKWPDGTICEYCGPDARDADEPAPRAIGEIKGVALCGNCFDELCREEDEGTQYGHGV